MIKIRNKYFDVVSISQNLAGVRKYAERYGATFTPIRKHLVAN